MSDEKCHAKEGSNMLTDREDKVGASPMERTDGEIFLPRSKYPDMGMFLGVVKVEDMSRAMAEKKTGSGRKVGAKFGCKDNSGGEQINVGVLEQSGQGNQRGNITSRARAGIPNCII